MSTEEGIRRGLRAASTWLVNTAADFDQMAEVKERLAEEDFIGCAALRMEIQALRDKARLLRGQAEHVLALRVERGR